MSDGLGAVCDEFYVSSRLFLKLDMHPPRETILHFFDRIRKDFPLLRKLRTREGGSIILEEDGDEDRSRRWIRLDENSLRFGQFAPSDIDEFRRFGGLILSQAPYHLTFSEIDFDHMELNYGFDLEYQGNHDRLVAETLMSDSAGASVLFGANTSHVIDVQPYYGIALSDNCDLQAYVEVKSRTSTYEVRADSYDEQPISVFLTIRRYWGLDSEVALEAALSGMLDVADELAIETVVPNFVNPLAAAIASA